MKTRKHTKLIQEGNYIAQVDVALAYSDTGWSPYLSVEDAYKLDGVRDALRRGDIKTASSLARVFTITPIAV
jgi:hypothetical protein